MTPLLLRRILQVAAGTLLGFAVVAVFFLGLPGTPLGSTGQGVYDPVVPAPFPAPELSLRTPNGERFTREDLQGEVSVIFFGFSNCPDVCPITLGNLSRALDLLEASGRTFQGIFVSVDPDRDTPEVLREYMLGFHPSFTALTGEPGELERVTDAWGIHVSRHEGALAGRDADAEGAGHAHEAAGDHEQGVRERGAGSTAVGGATPETGYQVMHSTRSFVVDRDGRVVRSLEAYLGPEEVVAVLESFLR